MALDDQVTAEVCLCLCLFVCVQLCVWLYALLCRGRRLSLLLSLLCCCTLSIMDATKVLVCLQTCAGAACERVPHAHTAVGLPCQVPSGAGERDAGERRLVTDSLIHEYET